MREPGFNIWGNTLTWVILSTQTLSTVVTSEQIILTVVTKLCLSTSSLSYDYLHFLTNQLVPHSFLICILVTTQSFVYLIVKCCSYLLL